MKDKLNEINEFTYQKLAEILIEIVPEYVDFDNFKLSISDSAGNYTFMNEFSKRLGEEIEKNNASQFVRNSFEFINCIGESNNLEVINILRVGILEILYSHGIVVRNSVLEHLNDKNKMIFSKFSRLYF